MDKKKNKSKDQLLYDECSTLSKSKGNGQLIRKVWIDTNKKITRYSLAYINHKLCHVDNGRVLGYDNAHGYHHKHYMGDIEAIKFINFEEIEKHFQNEFEVLYEKAKKL
jgi:ligand-binding sensor domain-containing protein